MVALRIALASLLFAALPVVGAQYPTKPIHIVVPYPAGGTADIFARYMGQRLSKSFGQPVVVENRAGAGGNIGSDIVAKSEPDGYTLLLGTSGSNAVNPSLYRQMSYDAWKDLTIIAPVARTDNVLVVNPGSSTKSVKALIKAGKSSPKKLSFASSGNGSVLHLSGVMLGQRAGMEMLHVPYKGTVPALVDVMAGRVDMMIANGPSVVEYVKGGKLVALAVTGASRASALPDVPTMMEAGVPDFDLTSWFAVMGPAAIPDEVAEELNREISRIVKSGETAEFFKKVGAAPFIMDLRSSKAFFISELNSWGELVKASGARVD
jgi:tripartite-type tricarboxylate transporter receptor subunit TctC